MNDETKPAIDPHPLSAYVAWAGNRNRTPILEVFRQHLPSKTGRVLELASGSGMHTHYFAPHFDHLEFHPSDLDVEVFDNIRRLTSENRASNVVDPVHLDLFDTSTWPANDTPHFDAIFCINIFQVAPLIVADGMMRCAAQFLSLGGELLIYGPFLDHGDLGEESNAQFNRTLEATGVKDWGLKDVRDINKKAVEHGLTPREKVPMPTNNFILRYLKN